MAATSCPVGRVFFIYDHDYLKKEEDDLKDAIVYFFPSFVEPDNQCALCGQLMGMLGFFNGVFGSSPKLYRLQNDKFAVLHVGNYTMALAGDKSEPDKKVIDQLKEIYTVFAFYQGSIEKVFKGSESRKQFLAEMQVIWDSYLPFVRGYGDIVQSTFRTIPTVHLPKRGASLFLQASHILQTSKRRQGVLGGCLLLKNSVLCSQLSSELTAKLCLVKPKQSHLPSLNVKTEYSLPMGLRLLEVYLTTDEYRQLNPILRQQKVRQFCQQSGGCSSSCSNTGDDISLPSDGLLSELETITNVDNLNLKNDVQEYVQEEQTDLTEVQTKIEIQSLSNSNSHDNCKYPEKSNTTKIEETLENSTEVCSEVCEDCGGTVNRQKNKKIVESQSSQLNSSNSAGVINCDADNEVGATLINGIELENSNMEENSVNSCDIGNDQFENKTRLTDSGFTNVFDEGAIGSEPSDDLENKTRLTDSELTNVFDEGPIGNEPSDDLENPSGHKEQTSETDEEESAVIADCVDIVNKILSNIEISVTHDEDTESGTCETNTLTEQDTQGLHVNLEEQLHESSDDGFSSPLPSSGQLNDSLYFECSDTFVSPTEGTSSTELTLSSDFVSRKRKTNRKKFKANMTPSRPEMNEVRLYIQGHSDIALLLLIEPYAASDASLIKGLWKSSLTELGDLEIGLKECLDTAKETERQPTGYTYLHLDTFERSLNGNNLMAVTSQDIEFIENIGKIHEDFKTNPELIDVILKSHTSFVYGHQSVTHETYFMPHTTPHPLADIPDPANIHSFVNDSKVHKKLKKDLNINLL